MVAQHPRFSPMRSFVACAALSLPLWCFGTANALAGEAVVNEHLGEEEAVAVEVLMQSNGVQTIEEETLAFSASEETPVFQSSQTDAMATTVGSSPIEGSLEDPPIASATLDNTALSTDPAPEQEDLTEQDDIPKQEEILTQEGATEQGDTANDEAGSSGIVASDPALPNDALPAEPIPEQAAPSEAVIPEESTESSAPNTEPSVAILPEETATDTVSPESTASPAPIETQVGGASTETGVAGEEAASPSDTANVAAFSVLSDATPTSNLPAKRPATGKAYWHSDDQTGKRYYYDANGDCVTGEQYIDGSWYYLSPDDGTMQTGFVKLGGSYLADGPKTVYYDAKGRMVYGEQKINDNWYYLTPSSGALATGFTRLTGSYLADGPKTVYYDPTGKMLYGEQQVAEKWYYLRPLNGARVENEAVYIAGESPSGGSSKVVYYDADGSMAYGERNVGGSWYYMQPGTGARTENSFVELDGSYLANGPKTVYYNGLGQMVYGRYQTTSGWKYFDPRSGAMQTGNESIIGSIIDTMRSQMGSTRGWYYENAALAAGGDLCWGGRGNWCATFTWWAFNNAGYGNLFCGGRTILDPQLILEWFCTDGRATLADGRRGQTLHGMERGDIVFFGYDSVPGVTSYATHVGYVTSVNNDGFWTIEGNAGGEVASVYHEINGRINRAFARPAYNS